MAQKTLTVVIAGDPKGGQKAFRTIDKSADETRGRLAKMGEKISPGLATAAGAVVAGVGLMVRGAWQAAEESAKIGRETERVIESTGAAAWTSSDQVSDLASSLSKATGADDELIQSGENLLLTFTRIKNGVGEGNDVFDQATAAALDMSTALGTDMQSASIQVGKALNDPIKGITALGRAGVSFTQEQKDMIRSLVETGDVLGAQKIILGELQTEFGGAAAAAATPMDHLRVTVGNLQEQLGTALIPVVGAGAKALSGLASGFAALPGPVQAAALGIGGLAVVGTAGFAAVAKLADVFGDVLGPAMRIGRKLLDDAALGVANLATKMGASQDSALKLAGGISGIGSVAVPAMAGITAAFVGYSIVQDINAKKAAEQKSRAEEFTKAIEQQTGALDDNVNSVIAQQFANEGVGKIIGDTTADVKLFGDSIVTAGDEIKALSDQADTGRMEKFEEDLRRGKDAGSALATEMLRLKDSGQLSTTQLMELSNQLDDTSDAYRTGTQAAELNKGMTDAMASSAQNSAAAAQQQADAIRDAADATRAAVDPFFAASDSANKLKDAQVAAFLTAVQYGANAPQTVLANENVGRAALDTEGAFLRLAEQMASTGGDSDELKGALARWVEQGWITQGQADQLNTKFFFLGRAADDVAKKNVSIPVSAPGIDATIQKLHDLIGVTKSPVLTGAYGSGLGFMLPGYLGPSASGNTFTSDGWGTVGEQGPELYKKTGNRLEIFSNPNSKRMLASAGSSSGGRGSTYVTINMPPGSDGADVVDAIRRYEKRNGSAWRN